MANSTDRGPRAGVVPAARRGPAGRWWAAVLVVALVTGPGARADDDRLLVEVFTEPAAPYAGARWFYGVRVLARVPLRQAALAEPVADGATLQPLGGDRRDRLVRAGAAYSVLERRWALVADRPGALVIRGPRLTAAVPLPSRGEAPLRERLETLTRQAPDQSVLVRPPPSGAGQPWLPAEAVSLSEQWVPAGGEVHLGVPLTRTLQLTASGALAGQLPPLSLAEAPGFKVYVQPPNRTTEPAGDDLTATLTQQVTYVPLTPGGAVLPGVRVPWWNLGLDQAAEAALPPRPVQVIDAPSPPAALARADGDGWSLPWVLAALFALAWALTLWRCRRQPPPAVRAEPTAAEPNDAPKDAEARFDSACRQGDGAAARRALLDWAARRWPAAPPRGLATLARRLNTDERTRTLLLALERHLYGRDQPTWSPAELREALGPLLRASPGRPRRERTLPPLWPTPTGSDGRQPRP